MNGTIHFSVLDGWWVEGYHPEAGWALTNERTYENQIFQDNLDAEIIYSLFENEILPTFYKRNNEGYSPEWVSYIKNTIARVSPKFTTRRMINDYTEKYYSKQYQRSQQIIGNDFELAKDISSWKRQIFRSWKNIEVLDVKLFDKSSEALDTATTYDAEVVLNLNEIRPEYIGVEWVATENMKELINIKQFELDSNQGGRAVYKARLRNDRPGTFHHGIRIFPIHEMLPNRQDFALLKWV
jgi:hypothetical protein